MYTLIVAGGCFWGMQELFRHQPGVVATVVGYTGGENANPTYRFHPGHAEALKISYDDTTSYEQLLRYFFKIHDPTTTNRQGNDVGTSYRSAIFYETEAQKQIARRVIQDVDDSKYYHDPVTTTLEPLAGFFIAEPEHQDYLQRNPGGYTCHYERDVDF